MVSFKDRLKAKLGKDAPKAPRVPVAITPHAPATPNPASSPPSIPERLWNRAYDHAKVNNLSTVDAYEKILSVRLVEHNAGVPDASRSADFENEISQNPDKRRIQMQQLVQHGLHKTEKDAQVKQGVGDGIQAALAVKEVVDKAIQASPEAAVAWVGVCFALEILMNPLTQASSNRQGIAYVVSRMEWYWNLSSLLLDENMTEAHSKAPRGELENVVTQLYAKLLLYQMKSVCYYHRSRFATVMRDLVKLENWDGELNDIQAAETAVQADSTQYNTASIRARLGAIAETAKSQNVKLDSISSAIREQTQQQERIHETSEDNRCLADLRLTDPRDDKKRIEETKGGLLKDAYDWVLDHPDFERWRDDVQTQLLWIRADPGKGKTMLLCGIVNELQKSKSVLSYFFCQATDSRINNATAVLRGLLYMLVSQQPSLISHIRKKYDHAGKSLFDDANAWVALAEIFTNILRDPDLNNTFLMIDALDECVTDLSKLLGFIAKNSSISSRVKWIVSSRNWPDIEAQLEQADKLRLNLELNAESVSAAVSVFIQQKVSQLAEHKKYGEQIQQSVLDYLTLNANDTFLWVALVCQDLQATARRNVLKKLGSSFPPGLDALYEQMLQQISKSDDAELCKEVLGLVALVYRPITLEELVALVVQLEDLADDPTSLREIISLCGSFLTLRGETVYFVHQSAKDFLLANAASEMFPSGKEEDVHHSIFARSLNNMSITLRRDIYNLEALAYPADRVQTPDLDPLAASRYSCVYWIDHLCDSSPSRSAYEHDLQDRGVVDVFLRKHYLYWLEALSLCKNMPKGIVSMRKLQMLVQGRGETTLFTDLVYDAYRFIMYHKETISSSPLQAYASALLFSPTGSLIRQLFKHEESDGIGIKIKPAMSDGWSACLQTLEGHTDVVRCVAISHDSLQIASASRDKTIKIWDLSSGVCLRTLEGHTDGVTCVAYSQDSTQLASASFSSTVKIWDTNSGACLWTLEGHSSAVMSVAFSHHHIQLASGSRDSTIKIWDTSNSVCVQTLKGHAGTITSVTFSHDSTRLASASRDNTIRIWDASSGACLQTFSGHTTWVTCVVFSHDSTRLASTSEDRTVKIWDTSGACLQTFQGHNHWTTSVAFSHNSMQLASASDDSTIKIWDTRSGICLQTLEGHSSHVKSIAFSQDSTQLASASHDKTVKIWDTSSSATLHVTPESHRGLITCVAFSYDSTQLASASFDSTVKIWDTDSGACLRTLEGHDGVVDSVAFSHDSTQLASASRDKTVRIWDASSGACLKTFSGHTMWVRCIAISSNSIRLASASEDRAIKIWDTSSGACLQTLTDHTGVVTCLAFSQDSTQLASTSRDSTIKIWDVRTGACLQTLNTEKLLSELFFDSTGSRLYTDLGTIVIQSSEVPSISDVARSSPHDTCLSSDSTWIQHDGNNMLWIPTEFRPSCSSSCGNMVGMGVGSGRVWICRIEP